MADEEYNVLFKDPEHAALYGAFRKWQSDVEKRLSRLDVKVYGVIAGLIAGAGFILSRGIH